MPTCGTETHPFSSHPTTDTTTQARAAPGVHIGQPAPKAALKKRAKRPRTGPMVSWGGTAQTAASAVRSRIATNRRIAMPRCHAKGSRFWSPSSEPGLSSKKTSSAWRGGGVWFKPTGRRKPRSLLHVTPHRGENPNQDRGWGGLLRLSTQRTEGFELQHRRAAALPFAGPPAFPVTPGTSTASPPRPPP